VAGFLPCRMFAIYDDLRDRIWDAVGVRIWTTA
jgi:hypothetical protein